MSIASLFRRRPVLPPPPQIPPGERVYAIGDIHGRSDLLDALIALIDSDDRARGAARTRLILLGDLVDRGPDARGVIARARSLVETRGAAIIMGNHEDVLIKAWEGDGSAGRLFRRIGGLQTLASYGVTVEQFAAPENDDLDAIVPRAIPAEDIAFLRSFRDNVTIGDYHFVHAGIRPGVPLAQQVADDTRWVRDRFLDDRRDHGAMIVHGHTIRPDVDEQVNRIGIDTGAYESGKLTAIGLEGAARWYLST